jgi:hypothetical protein
MNWISLLLHITFNAILEYSILTQYGLIPELVYINHVTQNAHLSTRQTQDLATLYACLRKSLTTEAHKDLLVDKSHCIVAAPANQPTSPLFHDGVLFLQLIIGRATIVTNALISFIIGRLTQLDEHMAEFNSDIKSFNTFINNKLRNY